MLLAEFDYDLKSPPTFPFINTLKPPLDMWLLGRIRTTGALLECHAQGPPGLVIGPRSRVPGDERPAGAGVRRRSVRYTGHTA